MTQLSDEILIAYADGELARDQMQVVDDVLFADPEALQHLHRLQEDNQKLSRAFDSMLEAEVKHYAARQALPTPATPRIDNQDSQTQKSPSGYVVPAIAASALLVCAGAVGGYLANTGSTTEGGHGDPFGGNSFWNNEQVSAETARSKALFKALKPPQTTASTTQLKPGSVKKWFESVADRHRRDAARMLDQYSGKSRNPELALFNFPNKEVAPSIIPVLKEEGLVFVGASPVQIAGHSYARLAYRDKNNGAVPVGLYVGREKGGSLTLERGYRGDDNYVRWRQGGHSFMLIGAVPHWRLIVLCVAVQRQLVE